MSKHTRGKNKRELERARNNLNMPFMHILRVLSTFIPTEGVSQEEIEQDDTGQDDTDPIEIDKVLAQLDTIPERYHNLTQPLRLALDAISELDGLLETIYENM